jgi:hypothetical protein
MVHVVGNSQSGNTHDLCPTHENGPVMTCPTGNPVFLKKFL